jgi:hypothetical protein
MLGSEDIAPLPPGGGGKLWVMLSPEGEGEYMRSVQLSAISSGVAAELR